MFVLTTVTRDCKNGDLYVSVDDNAYLTKEAASAALRARYEDFLKSMELEDNGASDENGNAMPGGYCISDEASIYDYADYANCQLLPIVVITTKRNPACYVKESLSMQIKLYGNGHSCNIPVQEIIDKYWKDETAPFSFEMSTAIGDETIAATAMLGEESPDTYPSIRLDSRNARKNSSATWFILETPNETNPYVTGYAYAGNDETESDSWITKIVDAPRGADDDSKRLVYIDDDIAETVDTKTASKLNTKYGNHCADYCATSDQLSGGKFDYEKFGKRLAANDKDIEFVEGMIVSKNENVINHVADILDALGFTATTGYYDPAEDKKANISDKLTGYYYCDM